MFQKGDYVVYGNRGVCQVEELGPMSVPGAPKDRLYYKLVQVYAKDSVVFTPVDNAKVKIRAVLSKEAALRLVEEIDETEILWVKEERERESVYKKALMSEDPREWVRIIKTLYSRGQKRLEEGKKVTVRDEKYLHMAEENLLGELAVVLEMQKEQVKGYLLEHTDQMNK